MAFLKNVFITFSSQVLITFLGLLISIAIARSLTPSGQGLYTLILLIPTILFTIGNLGVSLSNIYFGSSRKYEWGDLASNSLLVTGLSGFAVLALFALFYAFYPSSFQGMTTLMVGLVLFSVPFNMVLNFFNNILLGQSKILEHNLTLLLQVVTQLALIVCLILIFDLSLTGVILSYACSTVLASVFSVIMVHRVSPISFKFSWAVFLDSLRFGLFSYIGNLVQFFNYRINYIILSLFLPTTMIGYYSITVLLAELVWYLPNSVSKIILAQTPKTEASLLNRTTPRICRNTFFLTILSGFVILLSGKTLIAVMYGDRYLPAFDPLLILIPGTIVMSICNVLANELSGRGKPVINMYVAVVALVANVSLNLILIPLYSINGTALASALAYLLSTGLTLLIYMKITGASFRDIVFITGADLSHYSAFAEKLKNTTAGIAYQYLARNSR